MELFQLNQHESIMFNTIIGTIEQRMAHIDTSNESNLPKYDFYAYLHDALEIHNCRNNPKLKNIFLKKDRPWKTELDIPVETYTKALDDVIELLGTMYNHPIARQTAVRTERYEARVTLITKLKMHRQTESRVV